MSTGSWDMGKNVEARSEEEEDFFLVTSRITKKKQNPAGQSRIPLDGRLV
jgi:hypothetical protein